MTLSSATRRIDLETQSAVMQDISRKVASSGTGDRVSTIGAVGLTELMTRTSSRMFSSFSATVVNRN